MLWPPPHAIDLLSILYLCAINMRMCCQCASRVPSTCYQQTRDMLSMYFDPSSSVSKCAINILSICHWINTNMLSSRISTPNRSLHRPATTPTRIIMILICYQFHLYPLPMPPYAINITLAALFNTMFRRMSASDYYAINVPLLCYCPSGPNERKTIDFLSMRHQDATSMLSMCYHYAIATSALTMKRL